MRDELLAYLLGDLGPEESQRIVERLENDPIWQRELKLLQSCMKAHEADPQSFNQPADLVDRTCSLVRYAAAKNHPPQAAPASLTESCDRAVSRLRSWSFADLAVGAGVLLVLGMLLFPALRESRDAARRAKCQNNLKNLGTALVEYAEKSNHGLPHVELGENAGSFVVDLAESGMLTRKQMAELLVCPSSPLADEVFAGRVMIQIPTPQSLKTASKESLASMRKFMAGSYAYRFGYRDEQGRYRQIKFEGRADAPMLADAPNISVAGFQSPNHGGCGQNVVFQDLSARYFDRCSAGKHTDHLFLNEDRQHAAGRHARDVVLGRSEADPAGGANAEFGWRNSE